MAESGELAPASAAEPTRVENDVFFASHLATRALPSVPNDAFYHAPRPAAEPGFAQRAALTPLRFGFVLFAVGWAGILFQASLLQQIVFGAPVFEEMAKFGPALVVAAVLGLRSLWFRMPLAWISGGAFGVFEHFTTYSDEDVYLHLGRVVFHGAAAGLSMAFYQVFEDAGDVRTRWASTVVPTLFHWANNFGAVVFSFAAFVVPFLEMVALGWATFVTACVVALTVLALVLRERFHARARSSLAQAIPRLGLRLPPPPPP